MSTEAPIPTREEALGSAARLLRTAETETDRGLMERYTDLAGTWLVLASLLMDGADT